MEYRVVVGLCVVCGTPVRPNEPYTYREITGLEQVSRTGSMTTTIKQKQYTGRVFCRVHGIETPDTDTLFDLPRTSPTRKKRSR